LYSLDCVPPAGEDTVEDIFGDELGSGYGQLWSVFDYSPAGDNPGYRRLAIDDVLEGGRGYWVIQTTSESATLALPSGSSRRASPVLPAQGCSPDSTCLEQPLALSVDSNLPKSNNLLGNPFRNSVAVNRLRIATDSGSCAEGCTLDEAFENGITQDKVFIFTSDSYAELRGEDRIPPQAGLFVGVLPTATDLNPRLLFPRLRGQNE